MKIIVAGGRTYTDRAWLYSVLDLNVHLFAELVSGGATGADSLGELWAEDTGIPAKKFYADWEKYGRSAGHIRNGEMVYYADALIAFPGGPGTTDCIQQAGRKCIPILIVPERKLLNGDPSRCILPVQNSRMMLPLDEIRRVARACKESDK